MKLKSEFSQLILPLQLIHNTCFVWGRVYTFYDSYVRIVRFIISWNVNIHRRSHIFIQRRELGRACLMRGQDGDGTIHLFDSFSIVAIKNLRNIGLTRALIHCLHCFHISLSYKEGSLGLDFLCSH